MALIDLTGQRFDRLVVLERGPSRKGSSKWLCRCDCGTVKAINSGELRAGKTKSCGCFRRETLIDLTGQRFGRLVVLERTPDQPHNYPKWLCLCDCGTTKDVGGASLRNGGIVSCGCYKRETWVQLSENWKGKEPHNTTHRMTGTPEHRAWLSMRARCLYPSQKAYPRYGGRGIRVCDEWLHDFQAFFDHIGPKPGPGYSVDRIDNDGNYEPGNVRWATASQQNRNRRPFGSAER